MRRGGKATALSIPPEKRLFERSEKSEFYLLNYKVLYNKKEIV
jgi:hypothetical protein